MYPPPISEITRTIKHAVGQEVLVSAWWANGKLIRCRIGRVSDPTPFPDWKEPFYDVFPQEGNPHVRWLQIVPLWFRKKKS